MRHREVAGSGGQWQSDQHLHVTVRPVVLHWHGLRREWKETGRLLGNEIELTDDVGTRYSWSARPFHADLERELLGSTTFTPAVPSDATELILRARDVTISWQLREK